MTSKTEMRQATGAMRDGILQRKERFQGSCAYSIELATKLKGWVYGTLVSSSYGPEHRVAVSRIGKTPKGMIIDVTQEDPYVGEVTNVFNFKQTAAEIESLYQVSGWGMTFNFFNK